MTDDGLLHLKGMTRLTSLSLRGTNLTDAGLVHLEDLTQLNFLSLLDTEVTDTGIAELQKALPNCQIEY